MTTTPGRYWVRWAERDHLLAEGTLRPDGRRENARGSIFDTAPYWIGEPVDAPPTHAMTTAGEWIEIGAIMTGDGA